MVDSTLTGDAGRLRAPTRSLQVVYEAGKVRKLNGQHQILSGSISGIILQLCYDTTSCVKLYTLLLFCTVLPATVDIVPYRII